MCLLGRPQAWRKNGEHLETEGWPSQVRHWWKVRGRGRPDPTYRQIFVARFLPEATQEQWRSFDELQRRSASPDNAWRIVDAISNIDVTDLAPKLTVPTLIMCSRREPDNRFEQSRLLAALIPKSRLVPLDSSNHLLPEGDPAWKHFLAEIDRFLPGGHS